MAAETSGDKKGILLETGTNEFEIVEFSIGKVHYGINVAKVREDYFGPIAEPAEIEGLRAELKGLREGISSINETYNRAIKALETRAGEIEATIAKLAQANGWKR